MSAPRSNVVKFPMRRVADARQVFMPFKEGTVEYALEQAWRSALHAAVSLRRQEQSLFQRLIRRTPDRSAWNRGPALLDGIIATAGDDPLPALCARRVEVDAVDLLSALGAERARLVAQINGPGQAEDVSAAEYGELCNIEDQMEALVPISAGGAVALVRFLQYRMQAFEWSERDDRISDNLIAGLGRLGMTAGDAA